jgi:hypothetical protein
MAHRARRVEPVILSFGGLEGKTLVLIGLALDIAGIAVLFRWQVDPNATIRPDGAEVRITESTDSEMARRYVRFRYLTHLGFVLLLTGFVLQALGTYYSD